MTYGFIVLQCDCTVWPVLQHVKRSNAVYSVISQSFAKLSRKPWLKYSDQCKTKRNRYWVDQHNVFPVIIKHKHNMLTRRNGPKLCKCAHTDKTRINTDLMIT